MFVPQLTLIPGKLSTIAHTDASSTYLQNHALNFINYPPNSHKNNNLHNSYIPLMKSIHAFLHSKLLWIGRI
ncbi:hypothetical protein VINE108521_12035 [Vibrio neonatus]